MVSSKVHRVELVDVSPEMTKREALKLEYRIKRLAGLDNIFDFQFMRGTSTERLKKLAKLIFVFTVTLYKMEVSYGPK
jgi:hypothetical protein